MNPSSSGWINKFINDFPRKLLLDPYDTPLQFYHELRKTGFIYGVSVSTLLDQPISKLSLTKDEYTKVNLFHALWHTFFYHQTHSSPDEALQSMVEFYKDIGRGKRSFFQKLNFSTSTSENLERILSARLQETNDMLKQEAGMLLTHALLYADVLAFSYYLKDPKGLKTYLDVLEKTLIQHSILALQSKAQKNEYDLLVIDLVTSSEEFMQSITYSNSFTERFGSSEGKLEQHFVMDICCLAVWDDRHLDEKEKEFLEALNSDFGFSREALTTDLQFLMDFSNQNAQKIQLFEHTHPVKQFYKQSIQMVRLLILRNRKRLLTELNESGELLLLLSQSTLRELSAEEKSKVKEQLFDIFKTIPSLTIFILPGGAILLPLVVKLIPKLLPSAFHENRVEDSKKE